VIGNWGCTAQGQDPTFIAELFARALHFDLPGKDVRLGRIYNEIHFALPPSWASGSTEDIDEVFARTFASFKISFKMCLL